MPVSGGSIGENAYREVEELFSHIRPGGFASKQPSGTMNQPGEWDKPAEALIRGKGTDFPTDPADDDLFYHTSNQQLYQFSGSDYWLGTTDLESDTARTELSATGVAGTAMGFGNARHWLGAASISFLVTGGTALSASHKWVIKLRTVSSAGTDAVAQTMTIDSGSVDAWRHMNGSVVGSVAANAAVVIYLEATKTGTPGPLSIVGSFTHRGMVTA